MIDLFNEIYQTLRTNKLRTFLTGIAVSWGVFMLIVLLSMARGVTNNFEADMASGNNAMLRVYSGRTSIPYKGNREGRWVRLKETDMTVIQDENRRHVNGVSSQLYGGTSISTPKASVSTGYNGVFPSYFKERDLGKIVAGRFINQRDMDEKAKVMVLPLYYAKQLFPPDGKEAYGSRVSCSGLSFKVVGIYDVRWNRSVFIPFSTARMIATDKDDIGNLSVSLQNVKTEEDGEQVENDVRNTLAAVHNFDPKDDNAIWISNSFVNSIKGANALTILDTSVWVLGILTLLTGIVGISNIMFVTVKERTHEIGIRRAIGAKPRKILTQVIAESVSITLLFGYIGIVAGMILTQIAAYLIEQANPGMLKNPTVSIAIAVEVTIVLVISGALAGLFPALRALKVKPVEALRDE